MVDRVLSELADARDDITLVIDDVHELTSPDALAQLTRLLTNLPGERACGAGHPPRSAAAPALSCAWQASWPRSARRICASPSAKHASCSMPRVSSCQTPERAAAPADGRVGRGPAARGDLTGRSPRPGAFRRGVLRQRPHGRRVPDRRNAGAPARRRQGSAAAHLPARSRQRRTGRSADRPPGSERILLALEDANAFVVSLDPERTWFRYHHLFGDLLRLELRRTLPEEVPALHRRAAGWFTRHGQVADAIRHTQAAGDWPDAARLLADHSFSLTARRARADRRGAVASLPAGSPRG